MDLPIRASISSNWLMVNTPLLVAFGWIALVALSATDAIDLSSTNATDSAAVDSISDPSSQR